MIECLGMRRLLAFCLVVVTLATQAQASSQSLYTNSLTPSTSVINANVLPLNNSLSERLPAESVTHCPGPSIAGNPGDWIMYCSSGPITQSDFALPISRARLLPAFSSADAVNWSSIGDPVARPQWASADALLADADVRQLGDGRWLMTFVVSDTNVNETCTNDSAIGGATSTDAAGPWRQFENPIVAPRSTGAECRYARFASSSVELDEDGQPWLAYSDDGIRVARINVGDSGAVADAPRLVASNRFDQVEIARFNDDWWLFITDAQPYSGPLSGSWVLSGRSSTPQGLYRDANNRDLLDSAVGGTGVLGFNGNGFVAPSSPDVFLDALGQPWFVYDAVDVDSSYVSTDSSVTRRPPMIDPLRLEGDEWPTVRRGNWISSTAQSGPATTDSEDGSTDAARPRPSLGKTLFFDDFGGNQLSNSWRFIRQRTSVYEVKDNRLKMDFERDNLMLDANDVAPLVVDAPGRDWFVEVDVRHTQGNCNKVGELGLVVYRNDDTYLKLTASSDASQCETAWAREVPRGATHRYGESSAGAAEGWTTLRIIRSIVDGIAYYSAETRAEKDSKFTVASTWTQPAVDSEQLGLVAMGGQGPGGEFAHFRLGLIEQS